MTQPEQDITITEAAEAIGIQCIVIDENTDFDKLPSLTQLLGFNSDEEYLEHHKRQQEESLERFRQEAIAIRDGNHDT